MKFINFYSGTALAFIAGLLTTLGTATGETAPPLIVGALLLTVLVLGWAGGASDARHELDRLTRLEGGRQLQMTCNAAARDRLETAAEVLRAQVRDSQAAIELFTAAQAKNMIRITALEGENAELQKRPSSDVMMATAQRLIAELNDDPDDVDEDCRNCQARGIGYLHSELLRHMAAPVVGGAQIEPNTLPARMGTGDEVVPDQAAPDQGTTEIPLSAAEPALWHDGSTHPAKNGWYERQFTDGIFLQWWNGSAWAASKGGQSHWRQVGSYVCWRDVMVESGEPGQSDAGLPVPDWFDILAMQPLIEPVYIGKALMAHREARVVLDGGTGPVAAVHLVNIGLTGWVYTKETAEAYARGWNSGVRALRGALTEAVVGKLLPVALGDSLAANASTPADAGAQP